MRNIQFRGLSNSKKWVYGSLIYFGEQPMIEFVRKRHHDDNRVVATDWVYVDPDSVGQFTGLYDKNGKEIYEGDILGLPETDTNGVQFKNRFARVVEWINDGFFLIDREERCGEVRKYGDRLALEIALNSNYAGIASCLKKYGDYAVIGNIHDNPEIIR